MLLHIRTFDEVLPHVMIESEMFTHPLEIEEMEDRARAKVHPGGPVAFYEEKNKFHCSPRGQRMAVISLLCVLAIIGIGLVIQVSFHS